MNAYLIVWDESDGNDCTVYETIILAESEDDATGKLSEALETAMRENGTSWQEDGNVLGYYFECTDDCPEDCDGHGGTTLREVTAYATEDEARQQMSKWHSEYSV
jgi:hypothetical protein